MTDKGTMDQLQESIEEYRKKYENLHKETKETLLSMVPKIIEETPGLGGIIWAQYVPGFNDGDPCTFTRTNIIPLSQEELEEEEIEEFTYSLEGSDFDALFGEYGDLPDHTWDDVKYLEECLEAGELVDMANNLHFLDKCGVTDYKAFEDEKFYIWGHCFMHSKDGKSVIVISKNLKSRIAGMRTELEFFDALKSKYDVNLIKENTSLIIKLINSIPDSILSEVFGENVFVLFTEDGVKSDDYDCGY